MKKIKGESGGQKTVTRSATDATTCSKKQCVKQNYPGIAEATVCCCNGDLCNSTARLSSTMMMGMVLSSLILAFKKLMF